MTLSTEALDRLEAQAKAQHGKEIGTGVFVMAGQLLALLHAYRAQYPEPTPLATEPPPHE